MSLQQSSKKKSQREIPLKRINLGNEYYYHSNKSTIQHPHNSDISSKRLKYCFKHKKKNNSNKKLSQLYLNDQVNVSLRFHDTEYFRHNKQEGQKIICYQNNTNKGKKHSSKLFSNLLESSVSPTSPNKFTPTKKFIKTKKQLSQDCHQNHTKYYNFDVQIPQASSPIFKPERPQSSFERRRDIHSAQKCRPKTFRKSISGTKTQCQINPYTNQKYLYVTKKSKQRIKEAVEKIKQKQIMYSMLKPCHIGRKQLSKRQEHLLKYKDESIFSCQPSGNSFEVNPKEKHHKNKSAKKYSYKKKDEYQTLEPWEIHDKIAQDYQIL